MFGESFSPVNNPTMGATPRSGAPASNPIQEAIKILSLRLPQTLGAAGPTGAGLLGGAGGAGPSGDDMATVFLRRLLSGQTSGQMPGQPPGINGPMGGPPGFSQGIQNAVGGGPAPIQNPPGGPGGQLPNFTFTGRRIGLPGAGLMPPPTQP